MKVASGKFRIWSMNLVQWSCGMLCPMILNKIHQYLTSNIFYQPKILIPHCYLIGSRNEQFCTQDYIAYNCKKYKKYTRKHWIFQFSPKNYITLEANCVSIVFIMNTFFISSPEPKEFRFVQMKVCALFQGKIIKK